MNIAEKPKSGLSLAWVFPNSPAQLETDLKTLKSLAQRDPEFAAVLRHAAQAAVDEMMEAR